MPSAVSSVPISRSVWGFHVCRGCRDSALSSFHIHYLDSSYLHLAGKADEGIQCSGKAPTPQAWKPTSSTAQTHQFYQATAVWMPLSSRDATLPTSVPKYLAAYLEGRKHLIPSPKQEIETEMAVTRSLIKNLFQRKNFLYKMSKIDMLIMGPWWSPTITSLQGSHTSKRGTGHLFPLLPGLQWWDLFLQAWHCGFLCSGCLFLGNQKDFAATRLYIHQ